MTHAVLRLDLTAAEASLLSASGDNAAAAVTATSVLGDDRASPRARMAAAQTATWSLAMLGRSSDALGVVDRALLVTGRGRADPTTVTWLTVTRAAALMAAGRLTEAYDQGATATEDLLNRDEQMLIGVWGLGWIARLLGRPRTALRWLDVALPPGADDPFGLRPTVLAEIAHCRALLGDVDGAADAFDQASRTTRPPSPLVAPLFVLAGAAVRAQRGELQSAQELTVEAADRAARCGAVFLEALALCDLAGHGGASRAARRIRAVAARADGQLVPTLVEYVHALRTDQSAALDAAATSLERQDLVHFAAEAAARAGQASFAEGRRERRTCRDRR